MSFWAVAMHDLHPVPSSSEDLAEFFGHHDGAMLPSRATEGDGQVALALVNKVRQQENE